MTSKRFPWSVLELPAKSDAKDIRRAYAQKLKVTRPDDDAEAFQQLVQARDYALELAARNQARAKAKLDIIQNNAGQENESPESGEFGRQFIPSSSEDSAPVAEQRISLSKPEIHSSDGVNLIDTSSEAGLVENDPTTVPAELNQFIELKNSLKKLNEHLSTGYEDNHFQWFEENCNIEELFYTLRQISNLNFLEKANVESDFILLASHLAYVSPKLIQKLKIHQISDTRVIEILRILNEEYRWTENNRLIYSTLEQHEAADGFMSQLNLALGKKTVDQLVVERSLARSATKSDSSESTNRNWIYLGGMMALAISKIWFGWH